MSNDVGCDVRTEQAELSTERIMGRVRAVLDPEGTQGITSAQRKLFETVSAFAVQFNMDRKNPIVGVVDHIGNYWRNWLFLILHTGTYRPSKIAKLLEALDPTHPISQRMLTLNLRILERDGLIQRNIVCDKFNHVEYSLTPMGKELVDQITLVIDWVCDHCMKIAEARAKFDAESDFY